MTLIYRFYFQHRCISLQKNIYIQNIQFCALSFPHRVHIHPIWSPFLYVLSVVVRHGRRWYKLNKQKPRTCVLCCGMWFQIYVIHINSCEFYQRQTVFGQYFGRPAGVLIWIIFLLVFLLILLFVIQIIPHFFLFIWAPICLCGWWRITYAILHDSSYYFCAILM